MNLNVQRRSTAWVFWAVYALLAALLLKAIPRVDHIMELLLNDDLVRLVEVRDFLAGQGWADLMQYRMGPDGGTLMHWSRLVDAPIAALIWLAEKAMPVAKAEAFVIVVWPLALAGIVLALFRKGGRALGGERAGNFALLFGGLAILATAKFDAGSLDHHNMELLFVLLALSSLLAPDPGLKAGVVAGVACAIGLGIGFEGILFVAVMAVYVALSWVITGGAARRQALGFSLAFALGLVALDLLLRPDISATVFRCDAFGPDILRVGVAGATGLAGVVALGGRWTLARRGLGVLLLGGLVLGVAKVFSPDCLSNPLGQLSPDVARLWLGRITEAQSLLPYIQNNKGQGTGALISPLVVMGMAVWLMLDRRFTARALLMLALVVVAYGMTFYQIRGVIFLMMLAAFPAAAALARLYDRYRAGSQKAGLLAVVLMVLAIPEVPTLISTEVLALNAKGGNEHKAVPPVLKKTCPRPESFARFSTAPPGMVLASTNLGAYLLAYTPHRVLTSNFHRNNAGIQASIDIARAPLAKLPALLRQFDVRYVVYCAGDEALKGRAKMFPTGIWAQLSRHEIPDFLKPVMQDGLVVLEFIDKKES